MTVAPAYLVVPVSTVYDSALPLAQRAGSRHVRRPALGRAGPAAATVIPGDDITHVHRDGTGTSREHSQDSGTHPSMNCLGLERR